MGQEIRHNRFYIDLENRGDLDQTLAVQAGRVPPGIIDSDEITVNREVNWMVKDLNPGLIDDYDRQD